MKVYYAGAIDSVDDKGRTDRDYFKKIVEECGWEIVGAGFGDNPIISIHSSSSLQREIVREDLKLLEKSDIFLVVTDLKTFSVGSWIEMHEASKRGQPIVTFIKNEKGDKDKDKNKNKNKKNKDKVRNIFINTYSDKIIHDDIDELKDTLKNMKDVKCEK